jgi:release factor glutamine methyltransferase
MSEIPTPAQLKPSTAINKVWTIIDLVNWSTQYLKEKGFEDSRLNTELLLCHTLKCSRIDLYTHFDKPLSNDELITFKSLFKRRLDYEPIQYIIGETEFMGLKFFVDKRVLIPRQETEILVQETINLCRNFVGSINILDIGVGSGNITVSLAKNVENAFVTGIDVSGDALEVAKINVERHSLGNEVKLLHHDVFNEITFEEKFDIVVSNPPYISSDEMKEVKKEVSDYEPSIATTDLSDGLTYYKRIVEVGKLILKEGGWLLVEIAYNQKDKVSKLLSSSGYSNVETIKDYGGNFRVVKGKYTQNYK